MKSNDRAVALSTLVDFLEEEIRYYEQSRLIHLSPSERSRRIRLRIFWIETIKTMAQEIEAKQ
jgi:hypothetical protein